MSRLQGLRVVDKWPPLATAPLWAFTETFERISLSDFPRLRSRGTIEASGTPLEATAVACRRRDEKATIRGRQRHEITPVYRLSVVQTFQAWKLHDPKRENSRSKLQNVLTDSTAKFHGATFHTSSNRHPRGVFTTTPLMSHISSQICVTFFGTGTGPITPSNIVNGSNHSRPGSIFLIQK